VTNLWPCLISGAPCRAGAQQRAVTIRAATMRAARHDKERVIYPSEIGARAVPGVSGNRSSLRAERRNPVASDVLLALDCFVGDAFSQ
jgi:hypothetical protein